jgi:phosphopantetheine--protein transferase-like protein
MTTEETLREIVSTLGKVDGAQLTAETRLTGALASSFGRARLDANVRSRLGVNNPGIYSVSTFGELCAVLGVKSSANGTGANGTGPAAAVPTAPAPSMEVFRTGSSIGIGVDVESVSAMPDVADYREDDFYKTIFTSREIAYALLQNSPRASFAAMWCAKEAVHKIDASLARMDWQRLEVIHDANGKPGITVDGRRMEGALSLSHTDEIAFAAFVVAPQVIAPQPAPAAPASPPPKQPAVKSQVHTSRIPAMISVFALIISIAALALSFVRR